jgi:hypothetical protein
VNLGCKAESEKKYESWSCYKVNFIPVASPSLQPYERACGSPYACVCIPPLFRVVSFLISDDFIITSAEPLDALGTTVKGSIVAKFEHAYLLRVQVGREKLHGVLYHARPPDIAYPLLPPRVNTTGLALQDGKVILKRAPKKKVVIRKEVLKRDRNAPRPARTGYNFFFSEARTRDRELNPGRDDQERSAAIGEQWRKMTAEDRQVGMVFSFLCFVFFELFEPKDDPDKECGDRRGRRRPKDAR